MMQKDIISEYLGIEVTTICDQNCIYCFARAGRKNAHLSWSLVRQFTKEGFISGYRRLHITGGEPFLWPHFFDLLEYAFELGYKEIFINTAARILTPEIIARLAGYGEKLRFSVTINGEKPVHEKTRGLGTYDHAVAGLELLLQAGFQVELFTVVSRMLLMSLSDFLAGAIERWPEITGYTLIQMHRIEEDRDLIKGMLIQEKEFIDFVRMVAVYSSMGFPVKIMENPLANVVAMKLGFDSLCSVPLLRPLKLVLVAGGNITGAHSSRASLGRYTSGALATLVDQEYSTESNRADFRCLRCEFSAECRKGHMLFPSEKTRDYNSSEPFCIRVLRAFTLHQQLPA